MKRSGSGSQRRLSWPTHGSETRSLSRLEHEVGERAAERLARDHAVPGVAAGPAEPGRRVVVHRQHQSRGTPSGPPQWWVIAARRRPGSARRASARAAPARRRCARRPRRAGSPGGRARRARRSRCGRRACAARRRRGGGGRRPSRGRPSRSRPRLGRQRLGRDHQRVERHEAPPLARLLDRERLGRAQHRARAHDAAGADARDRARSPRRPCARRSSRRAARRRAPGRAPAGPDRRAPQWGVNDAARAPLHAHALVEPRRRRAVAGRPPPCRTSDGARRPRAAALHLRGAGRDHRRAGVCRQPQSIASSLTTLPIPHRVGHRALAAGARRRGRAGRSLAAGAAREPPRRPSRRCGRTAPKPAISRSTTTMRRSGCSARQEYAVHSPVKPAPTMDVAVAIARQRGPGRQRLRDPVEPEAARPVAGLERVAHPASLRVPRRAFPAVGVGSTTRVANVSRK